jgi:hypothetical protein
MLQYGGLMIGSQGNGHASASVAAFQSLLEEIDRLNRPLESPASLEHLLEHTHALSHSLSTTLYNLVRVIGGCDGKSYEYLKVAIDSATDSITTAKTLMLELHHLRKHNACAQGKEIAGAGS